MINRRMLKNFWLDPKFQGRFGFYFLIYGLVNSGVFAGFFYYWSQSMMGSATELIHAAGVMNPKMAQFHVTMGQTLTWFVVIQVAMIMVAFVMAVAVSHRIAGPVFAMIATLEKFRGGDKAVRVNLRKRDELANLESELNRFLDHVSK